jgi:hypothetical protein
MYRLENSVIPMGCFCEGDKGKNTSPINRVFVNICTALGQGK